MPNYYFYFFRADGRGEVSIKARVHWLYWGFHVFSYGVLFINFVSSFKIRRANRLPLLDSL